MGQRRDDGNLLLLGEPDDRLQSLLVDGTYDQIGASESVGVDDFGDLLAVAPGVEKGELDGITVAELDAVESQQESLVEFEVAFVDAAALDGEGQQQGDAERLGAAQGAEFELPDLFGSFETDGVELLGCNVEREFVVVRLARDLDHGAGLEIGGPESAVELRQLLLGDTEDRKSVV